MTIARAPVAATHDESRAFGPIEWLLFLGVGVIWGSSFLLIDVGLDSLEPGLITLIRVGAGALTLRMLLPERPRFERADRQALVVLAITWVAVPFTLFPFAEQHVSSSVAGMLNGAVPLFAAVVGVSFYAGRLTRALAVGVGAGFVGVLVVSVAQGDVGDSAWTGIGLILAATVMYGFGINMAAPLQRRYGSPPVMAAMLAIAAVANLPYGLWALRDSTYETVPVLATVTLGAVGTGFAFWMMGHLMSRVGPTRASFITYVTPVVSIGLGVSLRGDIVRPLAFAGLALVIVGAYLASRRVV